MRLPCPPGSIAAAIVRQGGDPLNLRPLWEWVVTAIAQNSIKVMYFGKGSSY